MQFGLIFWAKKQKNGSTQRHGEQVPQPNKWRRDGLRVCLLGTCQARKDFATQHSEYRVFVISRTLSIRLQRSYLIVFEDRSSINIPKDSIKPWTPQTTEWIYQLP